MDLNSNHFYKALKLLDIILIVVVEYIYKSHKIVFIT
jgi:hypothetical protein